MQIDGNKLIETLKQQRNEALDAVAMLGVQLDAAVAKIEELTPKRPQRAKDTGNGKA